MLIKTKWIWENEWANKVGVGVLIDGYKLKSYKKSRSLVIPGCEIIAYECYEFGKFAIRMRRLNVSWMDEKIFDRKLPDNIKTIKAAQRVAPEFVKQEVMLILKEQHNKYQYILDQL